MKQSTRNEILWFFWFFVAALLAIAGIATEDTGRLGSGVVLLGVVTAWSAIIDTLEGK